ncbi:unnamed protein product, partial [Phaeothamnion confervicola]
MHVVSLGVATRQLWGRIGPRHPSLSRRRRHLSGTPSMLVFDRAVKRRQRDAAAAAPDHADFEYLRRHTASVLVDRIEDVTRSFPMALDLGCHTGHVAELIAAQKGLEGVGGVGGVRTLVQCDFSEQALLRARERARANQHLDTGDSGSDGDGDADSSGNGGKNGGGDGASSGNGGDGGASSAPATPGPEAAAGEPRVRTHFCLADEEFLPFGPGTFDLVMSNLCLHWVNDLPRAMAEIRQALRPDGAFIGAMLGGSTLTELRRCLLLAEQEREGGMSTHTSPSAHVSDCGNLLQAAGFALTTVDTETVTVHYPSALALMEHLQGMGEGNAALSRRLTVSRDTLLAAAAAYQALYGEDDGDGSISVPASFQVCYMIGWAPHASQQQPKRRGSATRSLKDAVSQHRMPAGDSGTTAGGGGSGGGG